MRKVVHASRSELRVPTWHRVFAVVVAALYVLTLGLPALHLVLEEHALCAEHGELAHVDVHGHSSTGLVTDGVAIDVAPDASSHGHCDVPQAGHAVLRESHALVSVDLLAPLPKNEAPVVAAPHTRKTLAFAPKTSPPVLL